MLALLPLRSQLSALAMLGAVSALLAAMISYEVLRYADARDRVRHQTAAGRLISSCG